VAGQTLIEAAARLAAPDAGGTPLCILAAGETTVRVTGSGLGGRNQECALGMVRGLNTFGRQAIAASVGTDGVDGPTNAAGAIADSTTLSRAMTAGLETPERHLDNNDSYRFFDRLGDLIFTGPTNTNVGDLQVILIG
jgi:hydroxypyruvate reductase